MLEALGEDDVRLIGRLVEATTTFEPNTSMPRKPPGLPIASSIS